MDREKAERVTTRDEAKLYLLGLFFVSADSTFIGCGRYCCRPRDSKPHRDCLKLQFGADGDAIVFNFRRRSKIRGPSDGVKRLDDRFTRTKSLT